MAARVLEAGARRGIDWPVLLILVAFHLGLAGCILVPPNAVALVLFASFFVVAGFGITVGFHRLLSHRAFECDPWLMRIWATLGATALQGGPVFWAGLHREHHQFSDHEGDPHSPRERFWEGHILWMTRLETKRAAVLRAWNARDLRAVSRDPYMKWLDRGIGPLLPWLATVAVCVAVAGLPGLVWGGIARTVFAWHMTWLVNSAAHRWGKRAYATSDDSRNAWWLTPVAFGDQWHNNHHANPRAAVLREAWWQVDPSGMIILLFEKVGLARNVQRPKARIGPASPEVAPPEGL
jgi:stearoyl-CoA desaturase (delta-9 desaturase)